jgi:hypothetical protein
MSYIHDGCQMSWSIVAVLLGRPPSGAGHTHRCGRGRRNGYSVKRRHWLECGPLPPDLADNASRPTGQTPGQQAGPDAAPPGGFEDRVAR